MANLSPALGEELDLQRALEVGVIVTRIRRGTRRIACGFRPGDIIVAINDIDIESVGPARRPAVERVDPGSWRITVPPRGPGRTVNLVVRS